MSPSITSLEPRAYTRHPQASESRHCCQSLAMTLEGVRNGLTQEQGDRRRRQVLIYLRRNLRFLEIKTRTKFWRKVGRSRRYRRHPLRDLSIRGNCFGCRGRGAETLTMAGKILSDLDRSKTCPVKNGRTVIMRRKTHCCHPVLPNTIVCKHCLECILPLSL